MSREREHALLWARAPCHALLPKIPFPSCSGLLPKTFSWKLLPQSTRIWLSLLLKLRKIILPKHFHLLFLPKPLCGSSPAPETPSWSLQILSSPANLAMMSLERGAAFQHYISLSGLSNQPPAPQNFHGRKFIPLLPPPIQRGGKQTENGARAGREMTPHLGASITPNEPGAAACQH